MAFTGAGSLAPRTGSVCGPEPSNHFPVQRLVRWQSGGLIRAFPSRLPHPSRSQPELVFSTLVRQRRLTRRSTTGPQRQAVLAQAEVRGTFSQPGPSHPAAGVRLAPTLGLAGKAIWLARRISACRRGLRSHEKAVPISGASVCALAVATRQEVGASARQSRDEAPLRLIASVVFEGYCVQSVRWAAATRAAVHPSSVARRLEPERAKFCLRREAAAVIGQHISKTPRVQSGERGLTRR